MPTPTKTVKSYRKIKKPLSQAEAVKRSMNVVQMYRVFYEEICYWERKKDNNGIFHISRSDALIINMCWQSPLEMIDAARVKCEYLCEKIEDLKRFYDVKKYKMYELVG